MADKIIGIEEVKENKGNIIWRAVMAECLGTLLLNLFGCVTALYVFDPIKTSIAAGFLVFVLVLTLGHVSGGHFNPAVSVAMFATCNIGIIKMILYIVAQCIGAITGTAILMFLAPINYDGNYGNTVINRESINIWQALGCEFLLGFLLIFVVFGFCDPGRPESKYTGAFAVGAAITVGHMAFITVTGASMNPARSLGTTVIANEWDDHWVYWVGPIAGAVVAGLVYKWIFAKRHLVEEEEI